MPLAPFASGRGLSQASWRASALAPALALISCVLYCCNGELLQALQTHSDDGQGHPSALLNLCLCHLGGLAFAPYILRASPLGASGAYSAAAGSLAEWPRAVTLLFALLLMGYNYAWLLSSRYVSVGLTNAIFQTSIAFIYLASTVLFAEPLTPKRLLGVALALVGSSLASGLASGAAAQPEAAGAGLGVGVALALVGAAGNTVYQVAFKYLYGHLKSDVRFLAYFGAWVSVWHVVVVLPLVWLAHATGAERLELPSGRLAVTGTLVTAAIASTVNALYLCIVMWGSPMLLPCASAISVPLMVALDIVLHGMHPGWLESVGHGLVVLSVVLIMELRTGLPGAVSKLHGAASQAA